MEVTPILTGGDALCTSGASLSISNTNALSAKPRTRKEEFKPAKRSISLGETGSGPGNLGSLWSGVTSILNPIDSAQQIWIGNVVHRLRVEWVYTFEQSISSKLYT